MIDHEPDRELEQTQANVRVNERAYRPILDLTQDRLQVIGDRFFTFAGVLNFNGIRGHRVNEVSLARCRVELMHRISRHNEIKAGAGPFIAVGFSR